jgi:hypothetical protein
MPFHGAEANLPLTPLAQWMRETTGRLDDGESFTVSQGGMGPWLELRAPDGPVIDRVDAAAVYNKDRMYQAAVEAINAYINEGHSDDEITEHRRRIWELYEQLIGEKP